MTMDEALEVAWALALEAQVRRFGAELGLVPNASKSVRFASTASARVRLSPIPGSFPVVDAFRELEGGPAGRTLSARRTIEVRVQAVRLRFQWCFRLALRWGARVLATAAGVSAAVQGAGAAVSPRGHPPAAGIRAILRTLFRAAPEAMYCWFAMSWQADVAATVAILPWVLPEMLVCCQR